MKPGEVISYPDLCRHEGVSLQRGMNYRLRGQDSVILMSVQPGAPYADRVEENGQVLIYEGHDAARTYGVTDPKAVDQPYRSPVGSPTQNGVFFEAARAFQRGETAAERVRVYEKIRQGIWVFNGIFLLTDAWQEPVRGRKVFKFRLEMFEQPAALRDDLAAPAELDHDRVIPSAVKLEVWKRDQGKCVICGSRDNLHFDHVIPYSKGGSSLTSGNIQILCARHNLQKRDKIE